MCTYRRGRLGRFRVVVDSNPTEIVAETRLQSSARGIRERLPCSVQDIFHDRRRFPGTIFAGRPALKGKLLLAAFGALLLCVTSARALAAEAGDCGDDRTRLLKESRQSTIAQGLLKSPDGNSPQNVAPHGLSIGGLSSQAMMIPIVIIAPRRARRGKRCSGYYLFGYGIGFFFVDVIRCADGELWLQDAACQNPARSTIPQTPLHGVDRMSRWLRLSRDVRVCCKYRLFHAEGTCGFNRMSLGFNCFVHSVLLSLHFP